MFVSKGFKIIRCVGSNFNFTNLYKTEKKSTRDRCVFKDIKYSYIYIYIYTHAKYITLGHRVHVLVDQFNEESVNCICVFLEKLGPNISFLFKANFRHLLLHS